MRDNRKLGKIAAAFTSPQITQRFENKEIKISKAEEKNKGTN